MAKTPIQELGKELLASGKIHVRFSPFFDTYYIKDTYAGFTLKKATEAWLRLQFES